MPSSTRYKHKSKGRVVPHTKKELHAHPSHPYPHPSGRWHNYPLTSRIRDRKGKAFRHTAQERRRTNVKTTYQPRAGKRKRWD